MNRCVYLVLYSVELTRCCEGLLDAARRVHAWGWQMEKKLIDRKNVVELSMVLNLHIQIFKVNFGTPEK